jgi:LysM repeat protein
VIGKKYIQMKKSLLLATVLLCFSFAFAQNQLLVQHNEKGLFLNHTVVAKENYYSIGRLYNVAPKEIESFNGLDMNKGLAVGQVIKIPLNASNFSQSTDKGRPVFYTVGQKEGLYRVSQNNNDVLMANLRKWNKMTKDNISAGQKLIVGFLVSAEANNIVVAETKTVETKKADDFAEPKNDVAQTDPPVQKKEEVKKESEETVKKEMPKKEDVPPAATQVAVTDGKGGYFKPNFDAQVKAQPANKNVTASAGIFKTASGWTDAKYYALIDGVEPGTIIKVVNPTNSKVIYAKVLGEMSGIRQNQGYDVRISNAAASALEVSDTEKFVVKVNY